MIENSLTQRQLDVAHAPVDRRIFLEGAAGTGKTTAGVARIRYLLEQGVPAHRVLVLIPQRTLAQPYYEVLRDPAVPVGGVVDTATVGGLARRMIDLYWPLVAEEAGFASADERPTFLTLETAQYYMARVVRPLMDREGYFESITIDRNRLYSQILDNLNKAAVVGFPPTEIAERLKTAWMGELAKAQIYDQAQACALEFRRYCLEHNLLDFSLQMTVFAEHLWEVPLCRDYLTESYTHLIYDNVEEDTPVAHDIAYAWLGRTESALIIFDRGAGYRSFLGADPESARMLRDLCDETVRYDHSFVLSPPIAALGRALDRALRPVAMPAGEDEPAKERPIAGGVESDPLVPVAPRPQTEEAPAGGEGEGGVREVLRFEQHRFHPQMLDWVAGEIEALVHNLGVSPGEIVVLAPFLSDALRFSLTNRLAEADVPVRSHRPSRALRDEPATQTLLTLAAVAHPEWGVVPTRYDMAYALRHAIADLDLVRAQLLSEIVYRTQDNRPEFLPFDEIKPETQQRITFVFGGRYEALRTWFRAYAEQGPAPLDHFLARLFGELLSQAGFGFHREVDSAEVAAVLIESVRKFRWISQDLPEDKPMGQEYLEMVRQGVIAAQYLQPWQEESDEAVLLAPAYTFLLANRPVDYQVWLNIGGRGWWERLYQPITHPYVLSRRWSKDRLWTDADEFAIRQRTLQRLVLGLVRRCRRAIYLGLSELSEQGYEQEGPLLRAVQRVLREA
ncbi:MAG: UvrD-helicase domain-containing protein [Anaerolineae bacterium]